MTGADQFAQAKAHFSEKKFVFLKSFLVDPLLKTVYRYALMKAETGQMRTDDKQALGAPSLYGDTLMDTLLELSHPSIESVTGLELYPTYSYFRVYQNGNDLKPHVDRGACEISVTMTLGGKAENSWPIWFKDGELTTSVGFEPGDAVVYRGTEILHWRETFDGDHQAQVFLHYVDRNGPNAKFRFDNRPMLGASVS